MIFLKEINHHPNNAEEFFRHELLRTEDNKVLHIQSARTVLPPHCGQLTLKFCLEGESHFSYDDMCTRVSPDHFLIVNAPQLHSGIIGNTIHSNCICLYYSEDFVQGFLLKHGVHEELQLLETLYTHTDETRALLAQLHGLIMQDYLDPVQMHRIMEQMLLAAVRMHAEEMCPAIAAMPLVKHNTRREIYRRTLRARDFIETNFQRPLSLKEISQAAFMSDNYLMKYFRQVFGITPHQYIINKRLDLAKSLLLETDMMIKEVVSNVGFEDTSSFIRLFKFKFKRTPGQFRQQQATRRIA